MILIIYCPHCNHKNRFDKRIAVNYQSSIAFSLNHKCNKCGMYFDETDIEGKCHLIDEQKEMISWLQLLQDYAIGKLKWDTGGIWVCESHPCTPFEQGLSFDCECGGPGMPPFFPEET